MQQVLTNRASDINSDISSVAQIYTHAVQSSYLDLYR